MTVNAAAETALLEYLEMNKPGYALLLDAPWGAGKTHFINRVCKVEPNSDKIRYVTLNGVDSEVAFRRSLLKGTAESALADKLELGGNLFSKYLRIGDLGSLAKDVWEERQLKSLPDTLIFDDLERCKLDVKVLLGLLNEFVEHQGRRVILATHSSEDADAEEFNKRKEKVVGRTLSIEPDLASALPVFLDALDEGRGKEFFLSHAALVERVFRDAKHGNLRILRNALRDCSLLLDRIEDHIFAAKEPLARFVRTYLALAMALARGEISKEDFAKRGSSQVLSKREGNEEYHALYDINFNHAGVDVYGKAGATLSVALGEEIFSRGYVETGVLNRELEITQQFLPMEENPLWKRSVYWGDEGADQVSNLVQEMKVYLLREDSIVPGPYLHIADSLLRIESFGGLNEAREDITAQIVARIHELSAEGKIPAARFGKNLGWSLGIHGFSYGGYGVEPCAEFQAIIDAMERAQMEMYERNLPKEAEKLLWSFKKDVDTFSSKIRHSEDGLSYFNSPILDCIDVEDFVGAFESNLRKNPAAIRDGRRNSLIAALDFIKRRHSNDVRWNGEKRWLQSVRARLEENAAARSRLAAAQLGQFMKFFWSFGDPIEVEEHDKESEESVGEK